MARSTTRLVSHARLSAKREIASVVIRMMMAVNDAALANTALVEWRSVIDRRKAWRAQGTRMYFSRMQLGHALEAIDIIQEIQRSATLRQAVEECDHRTRRSFATLVQFIDSDDHKLLTRIRNNLSFHYSKPLTRRALDRALAREPFGHSAFSLGTEPFLWHFELADKIIDSIMVRDVIRVPSDQPAQPSTDEVLARLWDVQVAFADFAGCFARHHAT